MTRHLTPEEIVDAGDGALDVARAAHLDACAECAAEVASLRLLQREVAGADDVPEPSPLFWDHLSARVRAAAVQSAPAPWWSRIGWRSIAAVSAVAAAIALMIFMQPVRPAPVPDAVVADIAPSDVWLPAVDDDGLDVVLDLASDLDWDEVRQVAAPRAGTVEALIQELSPAEREALVKLLRREIGELE